MSNPEQQGDKPVSRPETEDNIPVQEGADKVENRPATKGAGTIGIVSTIVVVVLIILVVMYRF